GGDPRLVLHGGGNTSVKTVLPDLLDEPAEVLCVKGSGWDMANIEPAGLPAVRLAPLRKLRARDALPDEEMVRVQRANLLDPEAEGLVRIKHGVFSFGETAREAYERMIAIVSLAEERLRDGRRNVFAAAALPAAIADPAEIAPILRGACALPDPASPGLYKRFVL